MPVQKSGEDYLEAILVLQKQKGLVRSIDVAHHMDFSKPSVSRAMGNLRQDGLLEVHDGGELALTEKGMAIAQNIYERHTILTDLFISLGVPSQVAAEDACLVEHVISEETFTHLKALCKERLSAVRESRGVNPAEQRAEKPVEKKAAKAEEEKKKRKKRKK